MNFVTYADLNADIIANMYKIPKDVDLVVGIPRSGLLVANILALYINKPLCDFDSFLQGKIYYAGTTKNKAGWVTDFSEVKKVLIVEDSVCSGASIKNAKDLFEKSGLDIKPIWFASYVWKRNANLVDFYFRTLEFPRAFEWNYLHVKMLECFCFDIDGILCEDPSGEQNDDGDKYIEFLLNAPVKFLPTQELGCLVTSRLEKYREQTETWLKKHNIHYKKLFMMKVATAEERRKLGNHADFKAKIYKKQSDMCLFVESEDSQAQRISELSGKAVYCPASQQYYSDSVNTKVRESIKRNLFTKIYRFIPEPLLKLYRKLKYRK